MKVVLNSPQFSVRVTYLDGSALSDKDLTRACALKAKAVFVFSDKFSSNRKEEDASTILQAMSVKRYAERRSYGKEIMTCQLLEKRSYLEEIVALLVSHFPPSRTTGLQLILPESKRLYISSSQRQQRGQKSRNTIICVNEIKLNLLAKSCICPGLSTIVCNLITSMTDSDFEQEWRSEYAHGCGYEIYRVRLADGFSGMSFSDAASE